MISSTELVEKVKELAEKYPENVYKDQTCMYTSGKNSHCPEVGCIIGQALKAVKPDYDFGPWERKESSHDIEYIYFNETRDDHAIKLDDLKHRKYLTTVQDCQDSGNTWSEAHKEGEKCL